MARRWFDELFEVAADQYGYITTHQVVELGGTKQVLVNLARRGQLDRVAFGVYRFRLFPSSVRDELMEASLWAGEEGVISHESALGLWELCDVNPGRIHVSVPKSKRIRRQAPVVYQVHHRDLPAVDITRCEGIPVVTPRRAIVDGIEEHLDGRIIDQAIEAAVARGQLRPGDLDEVARTR